MSAAVEPKGADPPTAESTLGKPARSKSDSESGSESGARPVRRQLEKTNITKPSQDAVMTADAPTSVEHYEPTPITTSDQNGGASAEDTPAKITKKKRSFDDLNDQESHAADDRNARAVEGRAQKRSRDVRSGDFSMVNGIRVSPEPEIRETKDEDMQSEKEAAAQDKARSEKEPTTTIPTKAEDGKLKAVDEEMRSAHTSESGDKFKKEPSIAGEVDEMSQSQPDVAAAKQSERDLSPTQDGKNAQASDGAGAKSRNSPSPSRSPKKRSRDHLDEDYQREQKLAATDESVARRSMEEERPELSSVKKEDAPLAATKKEAEASPAKMVLSSGFANTSITSPFKSISSGSSWLKPSNPDTKQPVGLGPSASATLGEPKSLFKSSATPSSTQSPNVNAPASTVSPFGSLAQPSSMSASGSRGAFGSGQASGFSAANPSKLSSFAAPQGDVKAKQLKSRPFGAPVDVEEEVNDDEQDQEDDAEGDDADAAKDEVLSEKSESSNVKFSIQETATGEEDELSSFTVRAKLYAFQPAKGAWAERGVGPVKLNEKLLSTKEEGSEGKDVEARLVMRAAATHKVILNAQIFKEMKIGDKDGNAPTGKQLSFSAQIDGALVPCLLKMAKAEDVTKLYEEVKKVQEAL